MADLAAFSVIPLAHTSLCLGCALDLPYSGPQPIFGVWKLSKHRFMRWPKRGLLVRRKGIGVVANKEQALTPEVIHITSASYPVATAFLGDSDL